MLYSWRGHCESTPGSFDEHKAKQLLILSQNQPTWTVNTHIGCCHCGDWTFCSQDVSFPWTKHKFWTFRSVDVSFLGRFVPQMFRSHILAKYRYANVGQGGWHRPSCVTRARVEFETAFIIPIAYRTRQYEKKALAKKWKPIQVFNFWPFLTKFTLTSWPVNYHFSQMLLK